MRQRLTKHHIYPQHAGGDFVGTNDTRNIKWIKDRQHQAFHMVFENMTPVEQISHLIKNINRTALQTRFVREIDQIIHDDPGFIYERGILRPK